MKTKRILTITLSIIMLFTIFLVACGKENEPEPIITRKYELIADSDTIIINADSGTMWGDVPQMYLISHIYADGVEQSIETEAISWRNYKMAEHPLVKQSADKVWAIDQNIIEFETEVIFNLTFNDIVQPDVSINFKVIQVPIAADKLEVVISGSEELDGIEEESRLSIVAEYTPRPSYQDTEFFIEYVIVNGNKIDSNLDTYAYVTGGGSSIHAILYALPSLKYGDKIGVKARATHPSNNGLESEVLEIKVI